MVKIDTTKFGRGTYGRSSLDNYCSFICSLGYRFDSTHRRQADSSFVSFSFGFGRLEFDYGEWVIESEKRLAILDSINRGA